MILRYLYNMNPNDKKAEVIMESDTLAPMVSCVEHFWNNLGLEIPYFRFVKYKNSEIIIDFGNHYRFYHVIGYGDGLEAFATEWENARKIKG